MMYDVAVTIAASRSIPEDQGMHRTQIMLEEDQYEVLRERARQDGKSLGQVIRELLRTGLEVTGADREASGNGLRTLRGVFNAPGDAGRYHDHYLYGAD